MSSRISRSYLHTTVKRLQAHASHPAPPAKAPFNNKHSFNLNPPPVHEYWNVRNASIFFAFIPLYFTVSYLAKFGGESIDGWQGLLGFAKSDHSPLKELKFGEPQLPLPKEK